MVGRFTFRLLNEVRDVGGIDAWNDRAARKLWLYHLHSFDDLVSREWRERGEWHTGLIRRWVAENPPGVRVGWEPYPVSRRIVNWIKWIFSGGNIPNEAIASLADQARSLRVSLETHLLGNHLFANAKALVFAGSFFRGEEAEEWLKKGLSILDREIPEQVLPDGGHFERSPMYHSIILEDLLDLINLCRAAPNSRVSGLEGREAVWKEVANRMRAWLQAICHPDGEIALFNDSAFGIAVRPAELEDYAFRLGLGPMTRAHGTVTHLQSSGYVRIQSGEAVLLLDVGELGPDYLPAHGHADTLGFEMSLHGRRLVVDPGVSLYERGPERSFQRGTKAHNTVVVDGHDSSEVWESFRVARRARPFGLAIRDSKGAVEVECSHDGYMRLKGRVVHRRRWELGTDRLRVEDRIEGRFRHAYSGLLLHPAIAERSRDRMELGKRLEAGEWRMSREASVRWRFDKGQGWYEPATYHPGFGVTQATARLLGEPSGSRILFEMRWN